jgi:hypothetical protein
MISPWHLHPPHLHAPTDKRMCFPVPVPNQPITVSLVNIYTQNTKELGS